MSGLKVLLLLASVNRMLAAEIGLQEYGREFDKLLQMERELSEFGPGPHVAQAYAREFGEILRKKRQVNDIAAPIRISTTGDHAWMAPGPNDQRGPCPALNALANHGYLPRDGVCTAGQLASACYGVLALGIDLSMVLAVQALVIASRYDLKISIGLPTENSPSCSGLTASHNKFETDASPTRTDLYLSGNPGPLNLTLLGQMIEFKNASESCLTYADLIEFRYQRLTDCIATNPWFFFSLPAAIAAAGTYSFQPRLFANATSEYPEGGCVDVETLKAFYGVSEDGVYTGERIPDNWYRRPYGREYTLPKYAMDYSAASMKYPAFLSTGGNNGTVNSFVGLDFADPINGVYNAKSLADSKTFSCYLYQLLQSLSFSLVANVANEVLAFLKPLQALLDKIVGDNLSKLGCPELNPSSSTSVPGYPMQENGSCPLLNKTIYN
nr:PREDICTED: aromatic peroxygenase-like [Bemisia tabaci]